MCVFEEFFFRYLTGWKPRNRERQLLLEIKSFFVLLLSVSISNSFFLQNLKFFFRSPCQWKITVVKFVVNNVFEIENYQKQNIQSSRQSFLLLLLFHSRIIFFLFLSITQFYFLGYFHIFKLSEAIYISFIFVIDSIFWYRCCCCLFWFWEKKNQVTLFFLIVVLVVAWS